MITAKRLESGYWLIRGNGPCEWAQPPHWPCSEQVLREHAFPEASDRFIREAMQSFQVLCDTCGKAGCNNSFEMNEGGEWECAECNENQRESAEAAGDKK